MIIHKPPHMEPDKLQDDKLHLNNAGRKVYTEFLKQRFIPKEGNASLQVDNPSPQYSTERSTAPPRGVHRSGQGYRSPPPTPEAEAGYYTPQVSDRYRPKFPVGAGYPSYREYPMLPSSTPSRERPPQVSSVSDEAISTFSHRLGGMLQASANNY